MSTAEISRAQCVQQPCSTPGKSPELPRIESTREIGFLQEFCKV
jgi:hypothetical protein